MKKTFFLLSLVCAILFVAAGCKKTDQEKKDAHGEEGHEAQKVEEKPETLTIYSGRKEEMMKPIFDKFKKESGVDVKVQYGKSEELAATLDEEGKNTPADIFFSQDAGTLGWLASKNKFTKIEPSELEKVPPEFRSQTGDWVGTSGRARVLAYNTNALKPEQLPKNIDELAENKDGLWGDGKVGWAPENASFKAFVAALIAERGEEGAKKWLEAMVKLKPKAFPSNTPLVKAIGQDEILLGLTNHYYLYRLMKELGPEFAAKNAYFKNGKAESMINSAGVGIIVTSENQNAAKKFVKFMLSPETQEYFANQTHEFPVIASVKTEDGLPEITTLNAPSIPQDALKNLEATDKLLHEVGALN